MLWFLAEDVGTSVLVRYTGHADATIARWLERMGRHSQGWRHHLFRTHQSLAVEVPGLKRRYRSRSPAMALGLTTWLWHVNDLLHFPPPHAA